MIGLLCYILAVLASPSKSKLRLEAENAVLRHQLIVLRRRPHGRVRLTNHDRWFFIHLYRWFPAILKVQSSDPRRSFVGTEPAFRGYWRWKSRPRGGRPKVDIELRELVRRMSVENPVWAAPRVHGELLKLGFEVAQSSVAKYMVKRRGPPSQRWRTFLRNHAPDVAAMDLFVVPTLGFDLLYAFIIVRRASASEVLVGTKKRLSDRTTKLTKERCADLSPVETPALLTKPIQGNRGTSGEVVRVSRYGDFVSGGVCRTFVERVLRTRSRRLAGLIGRPRWAEPALSRDLLVSL